MKIYKHDDQELNIKYIHSYTFTKEASTPEVIALERQWYRIETPFDLMLINRIIKK